MGRVISSTERLFLRCYVNGLTAKYTLAVSRVRFWEMRRLFNHSPPPSYNLKNIRAISFIANNHAR